MITPPSTKRRTASTHAKMAMFRPLVRLLRRPKTRPMTPILSAIQANIAPMTGRIPVRSTIKMARTPSTIAITFIVPLCAVPPAARSKIKPSAPSRPLVAPVLCRELDASVERAVYVADVEFTAARGSVASTWAVGRRSVGAASVPRGHTSPNLLGWHQLDPRYSGLRLRCSRHGC